MSAKSTPPRDRLATFQRRLLRWFRAHGRDLPWRHTRDPWSILVSEVMLQQTQVSRVLDYWPRFLAEYPSPEALAAATPMAVRESWDGLGYYRRAANLHRLAQEVVSEYDGAIPGDSQSLRALPGVGAYTAGAVMSFAWERREPAVDTNVARVLRRAFHPRLGPGARRERQLWATARALLPTRGRTAWTFNQGIMELGALICTAREAHCGLCPVQSVCATGRRRLSGGASHPGGR